MKRQKGRFVTIDPWNIPFLEPKSLEKEEERAGEKNVGKCPHCQGSIVEVRTKEFDPKHGPQIHGPGGRNQWYISRSYHCDTCKTMFVGPPNK